MEDDMKQLMTDLYLKLEEQQVRHEKMLAAMAELSEKIEGLQVEISDLSLPGRRDL